jgi:hypothetical protein
MKGKTLFCISGVYRRVGQLVVDQLVVSRQDRLKFPSPDDSSSAATTMPPRQTPGTWAG